MVSVYFTNFIIDFLIGVCQDTECVYLPSGIVILYGLDTTLNFNYMNMFRDKLHSIPQGHRLFRLLTRPASMTAISEEQVRHKISLDCESQTIYQQMYAMVQLQT